MGTILMVMYVFVMIWSNIVNVDGATTTYKKPYSEPVWQPGVRYRGVIVSDIGVPDANL